MERQYDARLQTQTETWMAKYDEYLTHACTFTCKQEVAGVELTAEQLWKCWENYCKYLNRIIYKHAAKKHNKSLLIMATLHGELSHKSLHIHAAIGCVDRELSFDELKGLLNKTWRDMRWTKNITEIKPYKDKGWIGYMLHESVRLDLSSVDITRCFIPPTLKTL
jgi:hypothetical protein